MNLERERELFLEWLKKEYPMMHQWYLDGDDDWKTKVDYMFVAWLASASREGYVLVPVEPTPKMVDSTWDYDDDIYEMSSNSRNEFIYKTMLGAVDET